MAELAAQQADSVATSRTLPRILYNIFIRNLAAKIASAPMVAIVLIVFVGCTLWTIYYSFTSSGLLPKNNFVGFAQYERLFKADRWNISVVQPRDLRRACRSSSRWCSASSSPC